MLKRILKYLLWFVLGVILIGAISVFIFLQTSKPKYEGKATFSSLSADVSVKFDKYGIPHIYAVNGEDAYRALGYVHAQDRLFQMEMVRRVSGGTLAEVLGPKLIKTDKFFRTLGVRKMAEKNATVHFSTIEHDWQKYTLAYLEGINEYIDKGKTPLEFTIMGIPKTHFEPVDVFSTLGYMGLGFSRALKDDPTMEKIRLLTSDAHIEDWLLDHRKADTLNPSNLTMEDIGSLIPQDVEAHLASVSMPLWYGSNSWVISPEKSASGHVILANDTHIGLSQPSVWYEAHISYPGFNFYGNYLAGVPFGVIGHSEDLGWGLTIFPFDGIDLYRERPNPENSNQVWENDKWKDMTIQKEVIKVKDEEDIVFERKITRHGPIINEVASELDNNETHPISFWWNYLQGPTKNLEAIYEMNHATTMAEAKAGVSKIDFIGLNVLYGDKSGNIAHWAAGRIPKRPSHVNSKFILDGASGKDEILGYYDFSENPIRENPPNGFLASANNDPGYVGDNYYPGYYCPPNRYNRIVHHLTSKEKWSQEDMKSIQLDEISEDHKQMAHTMANSIINSNSGLSSKQKQIVELMSKWDGSYSIDKVEGTVFTKLLFNCMKGLMEDEIGHDIFEEVQGSYIYKGSLPDLVDNKNSIWWDNTHTKDSIETRQDIVTKALINTVEELEAQLGEDMGNWKWGSVHTITHNHPLGAIKPLDKYFNVGPYPITAGNDVPNKMMFKPNAEGIYKVYSIPALRILLDFADVDASESINPTGQSGNVMSPHYKDQTIMFNNGVYRPQLINAEEIEETSTELKLVSGK